MVEYSGFQGRVLVGKESTYGTKVTGDKTIGLLQGTVKIDETNNLKEHSGIGHRNTQYVSEGIYGVTGSFDYIVQEGSFPYFTLGEYDATSPVADTPVSGVYKHIINSADTAVMPSFSMNLGVEVGATDKQHEVYGCKVSSQSFSGALDSELKSTVNFTGKATDISGTTAPAVTEHSEKPYRMFSPGTIAKTGSDSIAADIQSFDFTITNTLNPHRGFDSRVLSGLSCVERKIAGNMTLVFEDYTQYEKFLSDAASPTTAKTTAGVTEFDTVFTFATEAAGSETAAYRGITFNLNSCKFNTYSFAVPQTDLITETFGFIAKTATVYYYDGTATDVFA